MISQFFVLSQRGDNIVFRDYRGEVQKGSAEIFFRKVKFWKEDGQEEAPPVFNVDGVNYFHVKVVGLLFVATTRVNVSPSLVLELLQRIARVIKDYLGVLNEDSLRKNFVLVYELLDEVIDFGYVQTTSTELLKSYVFNEPIVIDASRLQPLGPASIFMQGTKRMPGTAVTKSVVANEPGGRKREEIFVDIIEKISVTFSSSGYILTSEIDGTIQMKSYLTGNPEIRLALNDDLSIGKDGRSIYDYRSSSGPGAVVLDDCNFHESVRLDSFDLDRTLSLVPPDGEFPVMNYRMTQEFKPPFRINTLIEEAGALKAEVIIKISAEFPSNITANTVVVEMPLPKYTTRVSFGLEPGAVGQRTDFKEANKRLEWGLKKIVGGSEHMLRAKLTFSQESHGNITKESGPVSMTFTIPMYNGDRGEVQKGSAEIFFRKVKFWKEDGQEEAPPVFNVDGVNYFHVKVVGLLFVATTRVNVSPSLVLELLQRIARVIKDYLGVLNEDSLRKNFVLVYELLDEVIDFGYVQTTSTELLKSYVFNEPIVIDASRLQPLGPASIFMQGTKRMPGTAVTKSVVANEPGGRKREEIFVDIIEKISVTFSSSGYILTSEIDGTIQMKSYLTGNPEIRLALNDDLSIGKDGRSIYDYRSSSGPGAVVLDDCNFHESVRLDSFDLDRTLSLVPPDGEFPVMNYRMTQEFKPPFRINTLIEEAGALKAEVIIKISAEFPSNITANTVVVEMPLPKYTTRVSFGLEPGAVGQRTDFKEANKRLEWGLKKIVGGSEHMLRAKLTFSQESHGNITKESGPVSMTFTIPMYNASRLQVKYLQIAKKSSTYNPYRWVRYVTQANSYVARI
ncbi:AP-4 complex subunit mu [Pistacia vera]|uniref:AP-4 complex subunit mu n=1 Tax=Pistacia vera TaxID=55513 RepID=UPI001263A861|nr:AP-4 complex subunit mu [Pistacia vera]